MLRYNIFFIMIYIMNEFPLKFTLQTNFHNYIHNVKQ